jgi:hypothetical protein
LKTVKDMYVEEPPNEVMYCFDIHQLLFEEIEKTIPNIKFQHGLYSPEVNGWGDNSFPDAPRY